jgi:EAL and modified HD-GYP domain-containing signal transduction protein
MELFVARQPIFDQNLVVYGYELLFRSGLTNAFDGTEENTATSKVIAAAFYSPDGEDILGGKRAFVNFPRAMLVNETAIILPPDIAVIEVLENVEPDRVIVDACRGLRERGFRIALDDFVDTQQLHPLAPLADFIKVDLRSTGKDARRTIIARYGRGLSLLAEKVETQEEFRESVAEGFSYFQGYFFAKPVITCTREIPAFKLNYLRILQELHDPELDVGSLSKLIAREPSLSYKLLRFVNSALYARRKTIDTIEHALMFIGETGIRKWLSVVALMDLTSDKPSELVVNALVRARFAELLAPHAGLGPRSGDLFLAGIFSRLDAMLGRPLEELLDGLKLNQHIRAMLLGTLPPGETLAAFWSLLLAYESADWKRLPKLAGRLGIPTGTLPGLYSVAVKWADEVFQS